MFRQKHIFNICHSKRDRKNLKMSTFQIIFFILLWISSSTGNNQYVSIALASSDDEYPFLTCGLRIQNTIPVPSLKESKYTSLQTLELDACNFDELLNHSKLLNNTSVFVHKDQICYYNEQGYFLQEAGANMAIFLVDKYLNIIFDPTMYQVEIEAIQLLYTSHADLKSFDRIKLFDSTKIQRIDLNVIFLMLTALICIVLGMWWGLHLFVISIRLQSQQNFQIAAKNKDSNETAKRVEFVPATVRVSILSVLIMFAVVCGVILLAYFYPEAITYIIYISYVFAAFSALNICFLSLIELLPQRYRSFFDRKLYKSQSKIVPTIKMNFICTFLISIAIIVTFFALRFTTNGSWLFQNLIGVAMCIVFIANVRIHRFHVIVIIYCLFIVYDVFFVFVTPYLNVFNKVPETTTTSSTTAEMTTAITTPSPSTTYPSSTTSASSTTTTPSTTTKKPPSVMEYVALGLGTNGQLPIVFIYPYIIQHPDPCHLLAAISILGLGDVIIPGILGMYCAMFDFIKNNRRIPIYSISFCLSYILGLSATFIALNFMNTGQPALLYIIPATLPPILVIAAIRKEITDLFKGNTLKHVLEQ